MTDYSELRVQCTARPSAVKPLRHALAAFLAVLDVDLEASGDILLAVGEALSNAVEHAYSALGTGPGQVELRARLDHDHRLTVDIFDHGRFINRALRPGRGFGLRIVRAIARDVSIDTANGTHLQMIFDAYRGEDTARLSV